MFYALSLSLDLLAAFAPTPTLGQFLTRLQWPLLFLPAVFWFGATVHLLPEETPWQQLLSRSWGYGLLPAEQEAFTWFRTYVPERTLYNWQNAAAKLIAQNLRERQECKD